MCKLNLVIVGGGPFCTYALERLAALLPKEKLSKELHISIFDRTGRFGAGETHSDTQAKTSYMNRVASQIAFGADESNADSLQLLQRDFRPTFFQWCQDQHKTTGNEQFNLRPNEIPHRYLHGQALREMFDRYVTVLREIGKVTVDLHMAEVTDIARVHADSSFRVHVNGEGGWSMRADHILLVTGHSNNDPAPGSLAAKLARHAQANSPARYIPYAYPLEKQLTETVVPPGCFVAVLGLGLTAIDILLHLTEGRGGSFISEAKADPCSSLRYVPSGREPALIVGLSPSGMFTFCRPNNAKAIDGTGLGHSALEHGGVFLTIPAIQALRRAVGQPATFIDGEVRQLDFELHVFPLLILEMAYIYYTTLFGKNLADELHRVVDARYRNFLTQGCSSRDAGIEYLLEPIQACFEEVADYIVLTAQGSEIPPKLKRFDGSGVIESFLMTLYGENIEWDRPFNEQASAWGHSTDVRLHRFDWQTIFQPLRATYCGGDWQGRLICHMKRDNLAAAQGNLRNPVKAAADGGWRDLRAVLSEAVDFGGLTARSQKQFMETYLRFYNRMANGIGLEAMNKVLALVEAGLVDVSIGPAPSVRPVPDCPLFRLVGESTKSEKEVSVVIEGRVHSFDPERDVCELYPNMFKRGLVRRWCNPGAEPSEDFYPGALALSKAFHPIKSDGTVELRVTILGAPTEGVAFFQLSAARPQSNSSILNNVARWANEFVRTISSPVVDADSVSTDADVIHHR